MPLETGPAEVPEADLQSSFINITREGALEFVQYNLDITIDQDDSMPGAKMISLVVLNKNREAVGKLNIGGLPDDSAVARIIETIYKAKDINSQKDETVILNPKCFAEFLDEAHHWSKQIQSDFGRNSLDMLENYQRMIDCCQRSESHCETAELPGVKWTDINLPIADKTGLRELLAERVETLLPGLLSKHAPLDPVFLDVRLFSLDAADDCKIKGSKLCFFLIDGQIVSLHDGSPEPSQAAKESLSTRSGNIRTALSPASVFCEILQKVLDNNDSVVGHLESVLDSINRELNRSGTLSTQRIEDDIPDLLDSLRYCFRKFEATGRALARLSQTLRHSDIIESQEAGGHSSELNSLEELSDVVSQLRDKTKDLMEQANQILDTYKTNLNTSYEHSQKKSGLVQAITLPLSLGLAAAALMANRGAQPMTFVTVSLALTLMLAGWGWHKGWF